MVYFFAAIRANAKSARSAPRSSTHASALSLAKRTLSVSSGHNISPINSRSRLRLRLRKQTVFIPPLFYSLPRCISCCSVTATLPRCSYFFPKLESTLGFSTGFNSPVLYFSITSLTVPDIPVIISTFAACKV